MTTVTARTAQLVLKNSIERIEIRVRDNTGALIDPDGLTLKIFDQSENLIVQDDFVNGYGDPPTPPTHISNPTVGVYFFPFGDTSFDSANKTDTAGEYLFQWSVEIATGDEIINTVQVAKVISVLTMRRMQHLRLIIDKAMKDIDENEDDPMYLGYTDWMLAQYIEDGLQLINSAQPYPVWPFVDLFPEIHGRLLLDGAVIAALTSQEIFAIDTDINYSDNSNVFTIDHQPKLSSVLNATWARFTQLVPQMKRQYVSSGALHVQAGPNFRFQQLIAAAPSGSLFRNFFQAPG